MCFSGHYIRSCGIIGIAQLVEKAGVDFDQLLAKVGLDRSVAQSLDHLLPFRAVTTLFELASQETGMADFGVRLTQKNNPLFPCFGPAMSLSRFCNTVLLIS